MTETTEGATLVMGSIYHQWQQNPPWPARCIQCGEWENPDRAFSGYCPQGRRIFFRTARAVEPKDRA